MCLSIVDIIFGAYFVHVQGVYICIYVKKKKNTCVLLFIIECVYWCLRVTWLSTFVDGSSHVSFPRLFMLCIHFYCIFREWDEWPSPRSSGSLSLPSLRSLLMWLHFMSDLSWSLLLFALFVPLSSSFSLLIHHFHFTSYYFLTTTHLGFDTLFAPSLCFSSSVWFFFIASSLLPYSR